MHRYRVSYRIIEPTQPSVSHVYNFVVEATTTMAAEQKAYGPLTDACIDLFGSFYSEWIMRASVVRLADGRSN
jgi:hypothetical protein